VLRNNRNDLIAEGAQVPKS